MSDTRGSFDMGFDVHQEGDCWWAESSAWPGLSVAADSEAELMRRIQAVVDAERPGKRWYATRTTFPSSPPADDQENEK